MNTNSAQEIYNAIKTADNKTLWSVCQTIYQRIDRAERERDKAKKALDDLKTQIQKQKEQYTTTEGEQQGEKQKRGNNQKRGSNPHSLFDDKEALRTRVLMNLLEASNNGNAQASDKLAKLAGLEHETQDITIEIVDFSKCTVECSNCGSNPFKPVDIPTPASK